AHEGDAAVDEQRDGTHRQQGTHAEVHAILDVGEGPRDPLAAFGALFAPPHVRRRAVAAPRSVPDRLCRQRTAAYRPRPATARRPGCGRRWWRRRTHHGSDRPRTTSPPRPRSRLPGI